jgi:peroxiredoxin
MARALPSAHYRRAPRSLSGTIEAHQLRHRLIGMDAPPLAFASASGEQIRLDGDDASLVAYIYPGADTSDQHGSDTLLADSEEHRGFRDLHDVFAALHLVIIGVSSQPAEKLREAITANRLPQQLTSDPTLRLAELLNLPTFRVRGERFYHRLTIVIVRRKIAQVYYPVTIPGRHAAEVFADLRVAR